MTHARNSDIAVLKLNEVVLHLSNRAAAILDIQMDYISYNFKNIIFPVP